MMTASKESGTTITGVYPGIVPYTDRVLVGSTYRIAAFYGNPVHGGKVDFGNGIFRIERG